MIEMIKHVVGQMLGMQAKTQYGVIVSYNPTNYSVKVMIQPAGPETDFIPLAAVWTGKGMGAVFGPSIGDQVRVDFVDGVIDAALCGDRFFNSGNQPPVVQSGQGAIVDGAGSFVRLNNDGTITLSAPTGITATTPLLTQNGNLTVAGNILATGSVSDLNAAHGSLATIRTAYDGHVHPGVAAGSANTGTTTSTV